MQSSQAFGTKTGSSFGGKTANTVSSFGGKSTQISLGIYTNNGSNSQKKLINNDDKDDSQ